MNLSMQLALGGLRKKPSPVNPIEVAFQSLTANGVSGSVSTTQLTATFDVDPGLTTGNFVVTGASKGSVSNIDNVYFINVFDIPVNGQAVTLDLAFLPSNLSISPVTRTVTVYKAAALEAPTVVNDLIFDQAIIGEAYSFSIA